MFLESVYLSAMSLIRIRRRLVAPRACEMALMVKTRSNGLSGRATEDFHEATYASMVTRFLRTFKDRYKNSAREIKRR